MKKDFGFREFLNFGPSANSSGELDGNIRVRDNGYFEGKIGEISISRPREIVRGFISNIGELEKMTFLKFLSGSDKSNLLYQLYRESSSNFNTIEGAYQGKCGRLPIRLSMLHEFKENEDLFNQVVNSNICYNGDFTIVNVYRR